MESERESYYTFDELKTLGKAIKHEMLKIKMLKKIKSQKREQEKREVKRTIEWIMDNTLETMK